jgi:hypothetical protein
MKRLVISKEVTENILINLVAVKALDNATVEQVRLNITHTSGI